MDRFAKQENTCLFGNIKHALYMKNEFLKKEYKSELLTSKTNLTERSKILENFRNGKIEILCVVDILNEGVDIPDINLLLFLRPTLSSTVFIQQIRRGLRKASGKDFVTIIDFINIHVGCFRSVFTYRRATLAIIV